jgi:hypothetical protein
MTINLSKISTVLPKNIELFICANSFEERWSKVALSTELTELKQLIVINSIKDVEELSLQPLIDKYGDIVTDYDISNKIGFDIWKDIALNLIPCIQRCDGAVAFDITTLNIELLLFIISQLSTSKLTDKVTFIYLGAKSYGSKEQNSPLWLTHGVKDIRSVIGYPGGVTPSKNLHHLIILVGFELDRAKELILAYEPTSISLGIGVEPYTDCFYNENKRSINEIQDFISSLGIVYKSVSEFTFSCSDINKAKKSIQEEVKKYATSNITISPMNTKVSTAALGLAALENEDIKICYVDPLEYNKECYSEVGNTVSVFKLEN